MNETKKILIVHNILPLLVVGREVSKEELFEHDLILWDNEGCAGLISETYIKDARDLIKNIAKRPNPMLDAPTVSFSWGQTNRVVYAPNGYSRVMEFINNENLKCQDSSDSGSTNSGNQGS